MMDLLDNLSDDLFSSIYSPLYRERPVQWTRNLSKKHHGGAFPKANKPYLHNKDSDGEECYPYRFRRASTPGSI